MTWLRDLFGGARQLLLRTQQERDQLEQLLLRFRDERLAINTALTNATKRTEDLRHVSVSLHESARKSGEMAVALADIVTRLETLDHRVKMIEGSEQHIEAVKSALTVLRKGIQELQTRQSQIEELGERIDGDRRSLEESERRVTHRVAGSER